MNANPRRLISALCALLIAAFARAADVSIAPDRMLVVNGQRTFVIGLYEYPSDEAVLSDVARAGFNVLQSGHSAAALDRLHAHGLYAWCNTGGAIRAGEDPTASEAALQKLVEQAADHPALLAWEVPDEALWNTWLDVQSKHASTAERLHHLRLDTTAESDAFARGHAILKRLDPQHPIWMNHAAGNSIKLLASYARGADIIACDIYPLMPYPTAPFDYSRSMLAAVGLCATRMQASAPEKPVWMVLQGMGWGDFENPVFTLQPRPSQRPTRDETRFMAYDSIVRGARGVLYWGTYMMPRDSEIWRDILATARELADQAPLLTAPDAEITPTIETRYFGLLPWPEQRANIAVRALGKDLNGRIHWIVVNECPFPVGYTLGGLGALDGKAYTGGLAATAIQNGQITGVLPRYGVQILAPE